MVGIAGFSEEKRWRTRAFSTDFVIGSEAAILSTAFPAIIPQVFRSSPGQDFW